MEVLIVNPAGVVFEGNARSVILPGEQGVLEVLPYHRDIMTRLTGGEIVVDGRALRIRRGIVRVESDALTAIVEEAG